MGRILDGYSAHMDDAPDARTFLPPSGTSPDKDDIVRRLRKPAPTCC
jgi:hypothetical protein